MERTVSARVPFSGFYNSLWSDELDRCEESQIESMREDGEYPTLEDDEIRDVLMRHMDYRKAELAVCESYTSQFEAWLNEEFDLSIHLMFEEMISPKEYNFSTDAVYVRLSLGDLVKLYRRVGRKAVREQAHRHLTSRSGFLSFYNPDIDTWGKLDTWDYNQLYMVLLAAVDMADTDREGDLAIYYAMNESIYNAYSDSVDWQAVERDLQHEVDIQEGEAEEDARKFPSGLIHDAKLYAEKFDELNHLKGD